MTTTAIPSAAPAVGQATEARSLWQDAFRRLAHNRLALVGLAVLGFFAFLAVFAPLLAPIKPTAQDLGNTFAPASLFHGFLRPGSSNSLDFKPHVMGTDNLGRDWFSRMIYGARLSM